MSVYERFGKRGFDVLASAVLLLLVSPIMAVVSLLIRHEDSGAAIYRQSRVGRNGAQFTLLKFRSMPVHVPQVESALAGQLEVTRIGRFIRRTSLDELPQLINVVLGDMSLVGPRPSLASQNELNALRLENGSIVLRPGITGLAQVEGHDGMSTVEKARWDGAYAQHVSLFEDARILTRTIRYLLNPPPTY